MKQKDIAVLVLVAGISAIISFVIAGAIFNPSKYSTQVPVAQPINPTCPDVANDSAYNTFLNSKALDLTVPVQIGGSQNKDPFNND